jgi:hypothetical protein
LSALKPALHQNARLFIGVSGLHSPLARGYGHHREKPEKRFSRLNQDDAQVVKHRITQPVCLYTRDELVNAFETAGYETINAHLSTFGNIKCIFQVRA